MYLRQPTWPTITALYPTEHNRGLDPPSLARRGPVQRWTDTRPSQPLCSR